MTQIDERGSQKQNSWKYVSNSTVVLKGYLKKELSKVLGFASICHFIILISSQNIQYTIQQPEFSGTIVKEGTAK